MMDGHWAYRLEGDAAYEVQRERDDLKTQLTEAQQEIARLREALEVLANLGGRTSTGNEIAQRALAGTKEGG